MTPRYCLIAFLGLLLTVGCSSHNTDTSELTKYGKTNKIFLDYTLGMSKEDFYDHSWNLNDKGLVRQGPNNQSVYYQLDDELDHSAQMYFYPSFHNGQVYQMRVKLKYEHWAPWNDYLHSDSLQTEVLKLFEKWYGNGFEAKRVERNSQMKMLYTKQDNNRRIVIMKEGSRYVNALITDIVAASEVQQEKTDSNEAN